MDKHWSGRFTKATKAEVETFTASIFFDCALAEEDILGSLAHVQMLGDVGILDAMAEAQEIRKGLLTGFRSFFTREDLFLCCRRRHPYEGGKRAQTSSLAP